MVKRFHGVGSTGSRPRSSRLRRLSAIAADASISAHTSAEITAQLASDAASSGAPASPRITRAAARRRVEVALRTLDDEQVEGGGEVGQPNGHVPTSAPRAAAAASQIDPPQPQSPLTETLSLLVVASTHTHTTGTDIAAATLNAAGDSNDEHDAVPFTQLLASVIADAEVVPSSLPSSLSFIPATEPLPSFSHGESNAGSPPPPLIPPPPCPLPLLPLLPSVSQSTFVSSSVATSYLPSPPSLPPAGPQRVLVPVRIEASVDEREGAGPHSLVTGICEENAADSEVDVADGKDGAESEEEEESGSEWGEHAEAARDAPARFRALELAELRALPHIPQVLHTIGEGRCSVAAVMLAMGKLPYAHITDKHRRVIDAKRRQLGVRLRTRWSEHRWVSEVPLNWRMSAVHTREGVSLADTQTSYEAFCALLTDRTKSCAFVEPSVFYLAAEAYDVGIFVIQRYASDTYYYHFRPASQRHIVVLHAYSHYATVRYDRQRVMATEHPFVQHLQQLCTTHAQPPHKEEDLDLQIVSSRPPAATSISAPRAMAASPLSTAKAESSPRRQRTDSAVKRTLSFSSASRASLPVSQVRAANHRAQPARRALSTVPVAGTPLSPADVAAHGPLYDNITFGNIPQWVAMCTLPFNAYRLASQRNDRAAQNQAVEDILMLPQRVLTRTSRGGGDGKRLTRTIRARCRARGEELRRKYQCMPPRDDSAQLRGQGETVPLVHRAAAEEPLAHPTAQAEPSAAQDVAAAVPSPNATSPPAAANQAPQVTDDGDGEDGGDDYDGDYARAFTQAAEGVPADADRKAAKRAQWQVKRGHMQHAARTLHSTATMADLRSEQVRQAVEAMHPALPATSVIPPLPNDAPQQILEDDEEMVKLLRRSDNGSASGPSGWGGNMLSSLAQSDLCRAGIIALLKDILNGNLPDRARELLLASRLVALTKAEGRYRPIAVGELFPRLAGKLAMNKVTSAAAALLAPHQLGVGVPCGAERIVHSLQHTLTDTHRRYALLTIDIENAFNSCDRARVLRLLYEQPALSAL